MRTFALIVFSVLYGASALQSLRYPTIVNRREVLKPTFSTVSRRRMNFGDAQDLLQIIPMDCYSRPNLQAVQQYAKETMESKNFQHSIIQRTGGYPSKGVKDSIYLHLWSHISGKQSEPQLSWFLIRFARISSWFSSIYCFEVYIST